jgi:hypothetical protein
VQRLWKRLTYANVMSSLAVFLVLGGATAFAAGQLGKNTVGSKQLKKNAVTAAKIKKETVTGAKVKKDTLTGTQIKESTLGTVPSATTATSAGTANTANSANSANVASSLTPAESVHLIGTPGNPPFENGSSNLPSVEGITLPPAGFWKDKEGVVHLTGYAKVGTSSSVDSVFTLPSGFRPASGTILEWEPLDEQPVIVVGGNVVITGIDLSGKVVGTEEEDLALEGITFRAGS